MNGYNQAILSGATTSSISQTVNAYNLVNFSIIGVLSGTAIGATIRLQASNDFDIANDLASFVPTNWADIPGTVSSVFFTSSTFIIPTITTSYRYLRATYVISTGAGTITLYAKGNGW